MKGLGHHPSRRAGWGGIWKDNRGAHNRTISTQLFQQETGKSTLQGAGRPRGEALGSFGLTSPGVWSSVFVGVLSRLTVLVGLVLRLQPRDGQGGAAGGAGDGARE